MKKLLCGAMAVAMAVTSAGCGSKTKEGVTEDGKILLTVGGWPNKDANAEGYETKEAQRAAFMEKYPEIYVDRDTWGFSVDTFSQKAAADMLPHHFYLPFTEISKCNTSGYFQDVTDLLEEYGYLENFDDKVKELSVAKDGKYYCIPYNAYVLGLLCHKTLLKEAGFENEDGSIKTPDTFEELAQMASEIKKKTGSAGYTIPTKGNGGGWHFMNIAYGHGVEFITEKDGKYTATFADEKGVAALQFIKDLKWKYDALSNNALIDNNEMYKMYSTGQTAMIIAPGIELHKAKPMVVTNGMSKDDFAVGKMPKGPAGRYSLMGGGIYAVPAKATKEQADAVFKWIDFMGESPEITDVGLENFRAIIKEYHDYNVPIPSQELFSVWKSGGRIEKTNKIYEEFCNIDMKDVANYLDRSDLNVKPEVAYYCQELYSLLDSCIQEILTYKDADVEQILKDAAQNFQVNYLDRM